MNFDFSYLNIDSNKSTAITIGTFDGVHLGHQQLLNKTIQIAKNLDLAPLVLTFDPHPRKILIPNYKVLTITEMSQKIQLIEEFGISNVAVLKFTKELAEASPLDFVQQILIKKLKMKQLIVGFDFTLGKNRQGDINYLKLLGKELNFEVILVGEFKTQGLRPSSGLIRGLLQNNKIDEANKLLGWNK